MYNKFECILNLFKPTPFSSSFSKFFPWVFFKKDSLKISLNNYDQMTQKPRMIFSGNLVNLKANIIVSLH